MADPVIKNLKNQEPNITQEVAKLLIICHINQQNEHDLHLHSIKHSPKWRIFISDLQELEDHIVECPLKQSKHLRM